MSVHSRSTRYTDASEFMEMVPFLVRPFFRVLAFGLAALAAWAAVTVAVLLLEVARGSLLASLGFGFFALALAIFAFIAGSIALTASLPRVLVGPDDDSDDSPGAV